MKSKAVIFDIDGTLADNEHRQHLAENKDWKPFFDKMVADSPKIPIFNLLKMYKQNGYMILLVTGRPKEYESHTLSWLRNHRVFQYVDCMWTRPQDDYRPDSEIKEDLYQRDIKPYFDVEAVFDDRQQVVDMWRNLGLTCLQVAPGDF